MAKLPLPDEQPIAVNALRNMRARHGRGRELRISGNRAVYPHFRKEGEKHEEDGDGPLMENGA
jgi:hypothetical protein